MTSGHQIVVRDATESDARLLERLWLQLVREQESLDGRIRFAADALDRWQADLRGWLHGDARRFWVASESDTLIGFISAERSYAPVMFEERVDAFVTELYVAPDYRRRGIGKRLLMEARRWAESIGAAAVSASILTANKTGREFWRREGAEPLYKVVNIPIDSASSLRSEPRVRLGF